MNRTGVVWMVGAAVLALAGIAEAKSWETDFAKASAEAKTSGKYMLLDFSGSDWCGWCKKLDEEVFSRAQFKKYAADNLECVLVDFPKQAPQSKKLKEQNKEMAAKYGIRGFPTVLILSPSGDLVGKTGYREGGSASYVEHLKEMIDKHKADNPAKTNKAAKPDAAGKPPEATPKPPDAAPAKPE